MENSAYACECENECELPSTSGASSKSRTVTGLSAILGFAKSEYSLETTPQAMMADGRRLENENDGNDTDEEVEICFTRLGLMPDRGRRLYMDCKLSLPPGGSVPMSGGAEAIAAAPHESTSSPEVRYERLRNTAVEVRKYWTLQNVAIACPLSNCDLVFIPGQLLSHCLMQHEEIITVEMKAKEAKCLKLLGKSLPEDGGKSHCVGLLIYESGSSTTRNLNLPRIYTDWETRLPVLMMLWRTSWDSMPSAPRVTHLYILWLYCPQAQWPLMVTVETGENTPGLPRRQVIQTCCSSETLENCDLLSDSPHFMRFTHREMKEYTGDYTQDIDLQLTIREDETRVVPSFFNLQREDAIYGDKVETELTENENISIKELSTEKSEDPHTN
ncbi:uncharacterized protein LOC6549733 [Drosophila erecta]|uniref:DUF4729 domain-containing protein n=1 Tax=Drosophila erecta TaxID=7220 RepID=B3NY44_DROER|nr:uncharacterized protein LOC6549733 [Drosophila erecta]EDV47565.1 uncharacterized protein Dere_GG17570 [Drosophila erecta]